MASDKPLKDLQDNILDIFGPFCTIYENLLAMLDSICSDSVIQLDKTSINSFLSCVKHALLLVGDASAGISVNRRESVLKKINPLLACMAQEHFPDAQRQLFGPGFEQRLKTRSETADTIAKASKVATVGSVKPFFSWHGLQGKTNISWRPPVSINQTISSVLPMRKGFLSKGQPTTNAVSKVLESAAAIQTFVAPVSGRPNNLPTGMFFQLFPNQFTTRYSSHRLAKILSSCLEENNTRPMGLAGGTRVSTRTVIKPSSTECAFSHNVSSSSDSSGSGSTVLAGLEGCSLGSDQRFNRFHKFFICSSQKRWRELPGSELETPKSIFSVRTLQDGRCSHAKGPAKRRGLSSKDRSQGCLFDSSNLERSPEVLALSIEGFHARICMPSLWTGHSSQGLHKIDETCFNPESPRKSGICNQLQEIPTCTKSTDRISRFPHRFRSYVTPTTRRKVTKNKEAVSAIAKSRAGINSRIIKIPGPINLVHPGSISSPSSLQAPPETKKCRLEHPKFIRSSSHAQSPSEGGNCLVARPPSELEWPSTVSQASGPSNQNRCVPQRLGAFCEGVSTGGPWCAEEKRLHINCLELLAWSFAIKTFCKTKVVAHVKLLMDNISAVAYINKMGGGPLPKL